METILANIVLVPYYISVVQIYIQQVKGFEVSFASGTVASFKEPSTAQTERSDFFKHMRPMFWSVLKRAISGYNMHTEGRLESFACYKANLGTESCQCTTFHPTFFSLLAKQSFTGRKIIQTPSQTSKVSLSDSEVSKDFANANLNDFTLNKGRFLDCCCENLSTDSCNNNPKICLTEDIDTNFVSTSQSERHTKVPWCAFQIYCYCACHQKSSTAQVQLPYSGAVCVLNPLKYACRLWLYPLWFRIVIHSLKYTPHRP